MTVTTGIFKGHRFALCYAHHADESGRQHHLIWAGPNGMYDELDRGAAIWVSTHMDMPLEEFWEKLQIEQMGV
jgi:hypothetical protein